MLRRSSKRLKASFTAEPLEAAVALPFLLELRDGLFDLHKAAFDTAYFAYLADSSPLPKPESPTVPFDVVAPHVTLVANVTPRSAHPGVKIDLQVSSSSEDSDDDTS